MESDGVSDEVKDVGEEELEDAEHDHLDHEEVDADVGEAAEDAGEGVRGDEDERGADRLRHVIVHVAGEERDRLKVEMGLNSFLFIL